MTVLICRFKGNETLSELSENQLATYWTRKLPAVGYADSDQDSQTLLPTRDIAPVEVSRKFTNFKLVISEKAHAKECTLYDSLISKAIVVNLC